MIESLIEKLKIETEKLNIKLMENGITKSILEIIDKILNKKDLSSDEIITLSRYITDRQLDNETLGFIVEILLPNNDELNGEQVKSIIDLKEQLQLTDDEEIKRKYKRNLNIINKLVSKELFTFYDDLMIILDEYKYNSKEKFSIINHIIRNNYNPTILKKEKKNEEIVTQTSEVVEEVNCEEIPIKEDYLMYDGKEYTCSQVINEILANNEKRDFKEFINLFKKFKISYGPISNEYIEILCRSNIDIESTERILSKLANNKLNLKTIFKINYKEFVKIILFTEEENLDLLIDFAKKINIPLNKIIQKDLRILYSENNGGRFKNFMKNVSTLNGYNYNYKSNLDSNNLAIDALFYDNKTVSNVANLLLKEYKINDYYENEFEVILVLAFTYSSMQCIDRIIEIIGTMRDDIPFDTSVIKHQMAYLTKKRYKFNENFDAEEKMKYFQLELDCINDTKDQREYIKKIQKELNDEAASLDVYDFKGEKFETEHKSMFDSLFTCDEEEKDFLIIPLDVGIDKSLDDNEFVAYINDKYSNSYYYDIDGTSVSKVKVYRVLTVLKNNGFTIDEEAVMYALNFNYVYVDDDFDKITGTFNEMKMGEKNAKKYKK